MRLQLVKPSPMRRPVHLGGHTVVLSGAEARRNTIHALAACGTAVDLDADRPGRRMSRGQNTRHLQSGIATVVSSVR